MTQVRMETRGDVALITLDDGKANALTPSLIQEANAALDEAAEAAKAIVITGREGKLCAGFDLKILAAGGDGARELFLAGGELFLKVYEHPQPVVLAASGHAIAGGALLLATGDVRIGADGPFKIGLNEVAIGVPLPIFAHELARSRLDPRRLDEATLLGTLYSPKEAVEVGWLERVVEPGALLQTAMDEASKLAALNPVAYAVSKRSMRGDLVARLREGNEANLAHILSLVGGA